MGTHRATTTCRVVLVLGLLCLPCVAHSDDGDKLPPEPIETLQPISRDEIANAIKVGAIITSRSINGADIAALVLASSGVQKQCDIHRALRIDKSYIHSDVKVEPMRKNNTIDSDADEKPTERISKEPAAWVSIPIFINGSSIHGQIAISGIGFACPADFGASTFHARFNLHRATFSGNFSADGAIFKKEVEAISSQWQGPATFRRTQFIANAEFFPGSESAQSVFMNDADFQEAVFHRLGNFRTGRFEGHTNFQYAQFMGEALFDHTALAAGPRGKFSGPFYMTEFDGRTSFRGATFKSLTFFKTLFRNGVEFDSTQGRGLLLMRTSIGGRVDFSDAKIETLRFQGVMTAEGDAIFRRAQFDDVSFALVVFRKIADLRGVQIRSKLALRKVSFEGDVHLEDATLPITNHPREQGQAQVDAAGHGESFFGIEDTTLNGGLYADSQQLLVPTPVWEFWTDETPRFSFSSQPDPDETADFEGMATETILEQAKELQVWRELRHAFQTAGNLQLQNYAEYRLRALEEKEQTRLLNVPSILSRIFWGYGLRPLRVVFWLGVMIVAFGGAYWTQLAKVYTNQPLSQRILLRTKAALSFSAKTAWELKYGYQNSRTPAFRAITFLESVLGKVLLSCFAYSLSQTSPLLNELVKKLLP